MKISVNTVRVIALLVFSSLLLINLNTRPDSSPIKTHGTTAIIGFKNTRDIGFGLMIALIMLVMPKTNPTMAPISGPSSIPAKMTGICSVVALVRPTGTKPIGVNANSSTIAMYIAVYATLFEFLLMFIKLPPFRFAKDTVCFTINIIAQKASPLQ